MAQVGRIWMGVLGGVVVAGAAGGTFLWLRSHAPQPSLAPVAPVVTAPTGTAPAPVATSPEPAATKPADSATDRTWTWAPLPAGAIKIEQGQSAVQMTEPGLVRFDVQTGASTIWHWSRTLSVAGANPISGTDWAVAKRYGDGETNLLIHLRTGQGYSFHGGQLLWLGREGALFLATRATTNGLRQSLLWTDAEFNPVSEHWLPDGMSVAYRDWQREEAGWFRFQANEAGTKVEYRINVQTGSVQSVAPKVNQGIALKQSALFPSGCDGDSGGNQVKVYQGDQVLWTIIDSATLMDYRFGGSRVLADRQGALIDTKSGPTVIRFADGSLQPAPELKALDSPFLYAAPTGFGVAAAPDWQQDGSHLLRVSQLGQATAPRTFTLHPTNSDPQVSITLESGSYWSEDGRYLQVAVNYPLAGGKCGGGDDGMTFFDPLVVKGDFHGPIQVRTKVKTSLYAVTGSKENPQIGPLLRAVASAETFTVKGISGRSDQSLLLVSVPEGQGILLADPAQLEWVKPK